ncbi:MAG TPA: permease prefix domain 1-containing protein [Candidatus Limnocylindrales bacterium]|nr:permease prefix domain 1-containing protein [Candidatus Limnocylindrales bacterium]
MTTTPTLTDRYVEATLRRLATAQRQDIERELRSSIADAVDDRVSAGEDPAEAETAVLTGLGDPARLAASYANRPLHLIGPELFTDYVRVMKTLLGTVVPIVAIVVALVRVFEGADFGGILGAAISATITTALQIVFWVTLLFAIVERTGTRWSPKRAWTPADLPAPPSRRARYGELIAACVFTVAFAAFILLSPSFSLEKDASGNPIPVLDPWLWDSGVVYVFLALVLAGLGFAFARHYAKWSLRREIAGMLVRIAPSAILIWLAANDHVINPAFLESVGWPPAATRWIAPGLMLAGAIGIVSTIVETVRHARDRG